MDSTRSIARLVLVSLPLVALACPAGDDTGSGDGTSAATSEATTMSTTPATTNPGTNTEGQTSQSTVDPPGTGSDTSGSPTTGDDTTGGGGMFCMPEIPPMSCALPPGVEPPLVARLPSPSPGAGEVDDLFGSDPVAGPGFIMPADLGPSAECDIFAQDCGPGEKCMPWANDGGGTWNATRCSPIDPMPDGIGETCTVEGSGVSGIDSCDAASMCWNVDTSTNEGTCVEMCSCSALNPVCNTEGTICAVVNDGVIAVCLTACNPLDPAACPAGEGCYPANDTFLCAPDASGDSGALGEECFNINGCDPGLVCVGSAAFPGCAGAVGCCAATCESGDDTNCPDGTACADWFADGMAPNACWGSVGVCVQ